ncbi:sulfatase-like hydrolase/transferase [Psychrobacter sp. FDAARGOS_221]|uniref:sulfatase-like hydrolase/transferase n=1 Tax=Psychrobacter sp. FDAARGOS_221 TaxID=1975705 RepID=UPI001D0CFD07|nr:sulfatase-like hydrolase/transferase [Psychrobacter sp. FDAARGOS_221]
MFILTDQERYLDPDSLPKGYRLPGRERLKQRGVSFDNHQITSAVCTSSRSVIYTGQHIQQTKLFDNVNFPWSQDLDPNIGTVGQLLSEAGYYAAYKGKWHLSNLGNLDEQALPDAKLTEILESYGFHDYVGIGDVIGMVHGGWINDDLITAQAQRWLRVRGKPLNEGQTPWFLAVNLVNPHDVMFLDTDEPGEHVQDTPAPWLGLSAEPDTPFYKQQWQFELPNSRHEPFDKASRPAAHQEYQRARDTQVGSFPNEDRRWQRLLNYYYNCILSTDHKVEILLDELQDLGLLDNTIVVLTSDHGELGGSHGNHGKGATAYQEQNHVPLVISHPDYVQTHGQRCKALTSHLDLVPSFVAWSGADESTTRRLSTNLRGKTLTPLLQKGEQAKINEIREGALYSFNMFAYLDYQFMQRVQQFVNAGSSRSEIAAQNFPQDLSKRGAIRSVFDGRYKLNRYFSPLQHNQPQTLEQIFAYNDVELFDLHQDPDEMHNLAADSDSNVELIVTMNAKLNSLLQQELAGPDDGSFLPKGGSVG